MRVSVVATGIDQAANFEIERMSAHKLTQRPVTLALVA
jgi:hypothetical protein